MLRHALGRAATRRSISPVTCEAGKLVAANQFDEFPGKLANRSLLDEVPAGTAMRSWLICVEVAAVKPQVYSAAVSPAFGLELDQEIDVNVPA